MLALLAEGRREAFDEMVPVHVAVKEECERAEKPEELADIMDPFNNPLLDHSSKHIKNARGMSMYTQQWIPKDTPIKALVFWCHGYAG